MTATDCLTTRTELPETMRYLCNNEAPSRTEAHFAISALVPVNAWWHLSLDNLLAPYYVDRGFTFVVATLRPDRGTGWVLLDFNDSRFLPLRSLSP